MYIGQINGNITNTRETAESLNNIGLHLHSLTVFSDANRAVGESHRTTDKKKQKKKKNTRLPLPISILIF